MFNSITDQNKLKIEINISYFNLTSRKSCHCILCYAQYLMNVYLVDLLLNFKLLFTLHCFSFKILKLNAELSF